MLPSPIPTPAWPRSVDVSAAVHCCQWHSCPCSSPQHIHDWSRVRLDYSLVVSGSNSLYVHVGLWLTVCAWIHTRVNILNLQHCVGLALACPMELWLNQWNKEWSKALVGMFVILWCMCCITWQQQNFMWNTSAPWQHSAIALPQTT